jgi:zinc transporter ZupT
MRVFCNGQQAHLVTLEIKQPVFSSDLNLLLWMAILGSAGAMLGYWMLSDIKACVPYLLAVSGASFLYIALGDLLPSLHKRQQHSLLSLLMLLLGILTIVLIRAGKS